MTNGGAGYQEAPRVSVRDQKFGGSGLGLTGIPASSVISAPLGMVLIPAGLDPTNPLSMFLLRIEPVAGQPTHKRLIFSPRFPDRQTWTTPTHSPTGYQAGPNHAATASAARRWAPEPPSFAAVSVKRCCNSTPRGGD